MSDTDALNKIRQRIDKIDVEIQNLINARAECAREVAEVKQKFDEDVVFYRPERESAVLQRVLERNTGPLADEEVARLFREIMSACLALEQPLKVAFLGPEGTFTQSAAFKHFGESIKAFACSNINEVFREVDGRNCKYGVVPIENSNEGVVNYTLDSLMQSTLRICGEVEIRIQQCLLSNETELGKISKVYSHPQSLAQCRSWLDKNLPAAERIEVSSNAEAARKVGEVSGTAAIAGEAAAKVYDLSPLHKNIEDNPDNITRFLVIGDHYVPPSPADKTTLLVSASNRSGALYQLLKSFADHDISMTRIESRPSKSVSWDYVFFLDIEGHEEHEDVIAALKQLRESTDMVKILGSYPRAVL